MHYKSHFQKQKDEKPTFNTSSQSTDMNHYITIHQRHWSQSRWHTLGYVPNARVPACGEVAVHLPRKARIFVHHFIGRFKKTWIEFRDLNSYYEQERIKVTFCDATRSSMVSWIRRRSQFLHVWKGGSKKKKKWSKNTKCKTTSGCKRAKCKGLSHKTAEVKGLQQQDSPAESVSELNSWNCSHPAQSRTNKLRRITV